MKTAVTTLAFAIAALASGSIFANEEYVNEYIWTFDIVGEGKQEGAVITSAEPHLQGYVTIPDYLGDRPVVGFGERAFFRLSGLTGVEITQAAADVCAVRTVCK